MKTIHKTLKDLIARLDEEQANAETRSKAIFDWRCERMRRLARCEQALGNKSEFETFTAEEQLEVLSSQF
jgi:hypothetical protein